MKMLAKTMCVVVGLMFGLTACAGTTGSAPSVSPDAGEEQRGELHKLLPKETQNSGVINFAVQQHPPYEFVENDKFSGPISDLQNEIGKLLEVDVKETLVGGGLAPVLSGLLSDRYDAFAGPVASTAERTKQFDTVNWLHGDITYLVKADEISRLDDICGRTVAYIAGTHLIQQMGEMKDYCERTYSKSLDLLELDNTNATVLAINSQRAVAAIMTSGAAEAVISTDSSFTHFVQPVEIGGYTTNLGFILPKEPGIAEAIRAALQVLIDDGRYLEILEEWGIADGALETAEVNPPEIVK